MYAMAPCVNNIGTARDAGPQHGLGTEDGSQLNNRINDMNNKPAMTHSTSSYVEIL